MRFRVFATVLLSVMDFLMRKGQVPYVFQMVKYHMELITSPLRG